MLAVILILSCDRLLNKSQSEPDKTDNKNANNQPAPSPSASVRPNA
ncbi:hypothetical protein [Candidatus Endomicrobiellum agilis]|nr:hypothetical protein [Endomicrobium sp.]